MSARKARQPAAQHRPAAWVKGALAAVELVVVVGDKGYPRRKINPGYTALVAPYLSQLSSPAERKGFTEMLSYALQGAQSGHPFYPGYLECLARLPPRDAHYEWQRILNEQAAERKANAPQLVEQPEEAAADPAPAKTVVEVNAEVRKAHAHISIQLPPGSGSHHYVPIAGTEPCKPCPFCGEGSHVDLIEAGKGWWARVQCEGCGVHGPEADAGSEGEDESIHGLIVEAVRMWNGGLQKGGAK